MKFSPRTFAASNRSTRDGPSGEKVRGHSFRGEVGAEPREPGVGIRDHRHVRVIALVAAATVRDLREWDVQSDDLHSWSDGPTSR